MSCLKFSVVLGLAISIVSTAVAEDVRYYSENGVTYRETSQKTKRPVWKTKYEDRERTTYRERFTTETKETVRTVHTPNTQYRWQPYVANRWNPFVDPTVEYRLMPVTCWQSHQESVRVPVTRREWVPEKQIVRVPVSELKMVEEEVIRRVVVNGPPGGIPRSTNIAQRIRIGGEKLENDPPKKSTALAPSKSVIR